MDLLVNFAAAILTVLIAFLFIPWLSFLLEMYWPSSMTISAYWDWCIRKQKALRSKDN